jgi:hypothetical protein
MRRSATNDGGDMRAGMLRAGLILALAMPTTAQARFMGVYDYPFVSALVATVVATPPANQAAMVSPERVAAVAETRYLRVFPDRRVPDVFWYFGRGLPYGVFKQPNARAPLVFVIGGTGAGYDASKSQILIRALYQAGYHVVSLPNPTHPSFIVTASSEGVPGRLKEDAADLYRVMRLIDRDLRGELEITDYSVAGYSLGAAHAAFVGREDDTERAFRFEKVLVVNPPVSLYHSVKRLDAMFDRHLAKDPRTVNVFVNRIFQEVIGLYDVRDRIDFTDPAFFYRAYTVLEPPERDLELLIGLAFRFTSNDLAFASDVMTNAGYVVPKDAELTSTTSLTRVFLQGMGLNFVDYFDGVYLPFMQSRHPELTREDLIEAASLRAIEPYLRTNPRVVMAGTRDDVILHRSEVAWLNDVFGERSRIFPTGGHCGSMDQREFIAAIYELLAQ